MARGVGLYAHSISVSTSYIYRPKFVIARSKATKQSLSEIGFVEILTDASKARTTVILSFFVHVLCGQFNVTYL